MKKQMTRREFLRLLAMGGGALAASPLLKGCAPQPAQPVPQPTLPQPNSPEPVTAAPIQPQSTLTRAADTPRPQTVTPRDGAPYMVVARNGDPSAMVERAMTALGGMERFVKAGDVVIIKPNICTAYHSYEYASTTNPWVVGALVKLCLGAGAAKVQVMDFPFGGTTEEAYKISGIEEQVIAAGGEMVPMYSMRYKDYNIQGAIGLKKTQVLDPVMKADVLINVPIAKHHNLATLTLGMKNLMGLIVDRGSVHRVMGNGLVDLATLIRPTLTVMDGVRILMDNGPTGGNLADVKELNTLVISSDVSAVDAYCTSWFGKQPDEISYVAAATARGFGRTDLANLKIEEINLGA